ncbi:hypothetical protein OsJ_12493 [Oryza sativa Japonica Group]|uniref:Magnesium-dependent phosphatase 1 n=7 Tax=Oryza TaxID=4527 RepID=B9FBP7_ORYSJ|nr:hypothetical protein OsJ_12493 [Oryza sativa Japonica Group]
MGDERVKAEALQILGLFQALPRLVVFDLDYTLWPFYWYPISSLSLLAFFRSSIEEKLESECRSKRESPSLYRHAKGIMFALREKGIDMAIASRSPTPDIAKVFIDKLEIKSMFVAQTSRSLASPPPVIHPSRSDEPSRRDAAGERLLRRRPPPQMGDERVKAEALQILGLFQALPRLVVFDLDYTLWPFYCECRSKRESPSLYRHAKGIMFALREKGIDMAIASRSPTPDIAKVFIDKLEIKSMFVAQEIFSSWTHKTEHFQKIQRKTGIPYKSMLFFDDEDRNIESISKMGVTSVLVENGVNLDMFKLGLSNFATNVAASSTSKDE